RPPRGRAHGADRTHRLRERAATRAVRRDAATGRVVPGAAARAAGTADGRAVRCAGRADPGTAQRRAQPDLAGDRHHHAPGDALHRRGGLPRYPRRGAQPATRPGGGRPRRGPAGRTGLRHGHVRPAHRPAHRPDPRDARPRDRGGAVRLERFSLNLATTRYWPLEEAVAGCAAAGVGNIGLWREETTAYGVDRAAVLVKEAGLGVTSLCRGGFFAADGWLDDNCRAIEEAAV